MILFIIATAIIAHIDHWAFGTWFLIFLAALIFVAESE